MHACSPAQELMFTPLMADADVTMEPCYPKGALGEGIDFKMRSMTHWDGSMTHWDGSMTHWP